MSLDLTKEAAYKELQYFPCVLSSIGTIVPLSKGNITSRLALMFMKAHGQRRPPLEVKPLLK